MDLKACLHQCNTGNHDLVEILRAGDDEEIERVARWCRICGAIVVDYEYDRRLSGNCLKMMGPQALKLVQIYYE